MSKSKTSSEKKRGELIVVSGPSGAGKGTVIKKLLERRDADVSISATTRAPRGSEVNGVDYIFVTPEEFEQMRQNGDFLEYADVFSHKYGSPKGPVLEKLARGRDVIFDIDVQGAMQIKHNYPDAILIFIMPPSEEVLKKRLEGRGTETAVQVEERFGKAQEEMARAKEYDYVVVNDKLENTVDEIENILRSK